MWSYKIPCWGEDIGRREKQKLISGHSATCWTARYCWEVSRVRVEMLGITGLDLKSYIDALAELWTVCFYSQDFLLSFSYYNMFQGHQYIPGARYRFGSQCGCVNLYAQSSSRWAVYCLGHHPGDLILNDFLMPVGPLLPLAVRFPRAPLAQATVKTSDSPELISELLLWGHVVRLHSGSQIFRGAFGGCGRKRPCLPGWECQEGHLGIGLSSLPRLWRSLCFVSTV